MAKAKAQKCNEHDDVEAVNAYMKSLEHPLKSMIAEIRRAILKADERIFKHRRGDGRKVYASSEQSAP